MNEANEFLSHWSDMIDRPILLNTKQGFLLNNGWKIFFESYHLTTANRKTLKHHYKKQGF